MIDQPIATNSPGRLTWSTIFGGTFAALGLWLLLTLLGLAIGLSTLEPGDANLSGVLVWLGVWSFVTMLAVMFIGSLVAARTALVRHRRTGLIYGVVVWGLTTCLGAVFAFMLTTRVVGGTLGLASRVLGVTGAAAASLVRGIDLGGGAQVVQAVGNFLNIDRGDLMRTINQQLAARGAPPVTAAQLQAALQDAVNTALRRGELNDQILVSSLAQHTPLEREEVRQVAQQLLAEWNQAVGALSTQLQQIAVSTQNAMFTALNQVGNAAWWLFFANLLGLGAALGGGYLAVRSGRRDEGLDPSGLPTLARRPQPAPAG